MAINDPFITPQDTVPTTGPDAETLWTILRSVPDILRDLMTDIETADFLNDLQTQYQLSFEQRWALAEFLRDILMGIALPNDAVAALAERVNVRKTTATQIIHEIEATLLSRAGMTIADIARVISGPSIRQEAGRILLRYKSLDDLMASIEDMPTEERTLFLKEAKVDNRIMVLKALTQLKLGVDRKGRPMTFRQLAVLEAPDFSAQDWLDVYTEDKTILSENEVVAALVSFLGNAGRIADLFTVLEDVDAVRAFYESLGRALVRAKPAVTDYVRWSPFFAGLFDKDRGINARLFQFFSELEPGIRRNLVSPEVSNAIENAIRENVFPKNYGVAVAKIVFMVTVGDLGIETLPALLTEKLGLDREQGSSAADRIASLIDVISTSGQEPSAAERGGQEEEPEPQTDNGRSANRAGNDNIDARSNIVDLRKATSEE